MTADLILGINAYHADAAACIVRGGQLIAAAEEERFRRTKQLVQLPQLLFEKIPLFALPEALENTRM